MFNTKYGPFDGKTWEDLCQMIFKKKYEKESYQKIPASPGDFGLEGFTLSSGLAFQCYCPEKHYDRKELYEKRGGSGNLNNTYKWYFAPQMML